MDKTKQQEAPTRGGSAFSEGLGPEQIEALAVKHEAFGFGRVDAKGFTTHGFDPDGLEAFAAALLAAERERGDIEAARYRYLRRDFSAMSANIDGNHSWVYKRQFSLLGLTLDAAIDAAILKALPRGA